MFGTCVLSIDWMETRAKIVKPTINDYIVIHKWNILVLVFGSFTCASSCVDVVIECNKCTHFQSGVS